MDDCHDHRVPSTHSILATARVKRVDRALLRGCVENVAPIPGCQKLLNRQAVSPSVHVAVFGDLAVLVGGYHAAVEFEFGPFQGTDGVVEVLVAR